MLFKKRNSRPTAEEAARRLLALKCVTVDAHAAPPAEMLERFEPDWTEIQRCEFAQEERAHRNHYWDQVRESGLWRELSPSERRYAGMPKTQMTNQQWLDACWRLESAQVLMWALGLLSEMPTYDTQADLEELKAVPHERLGWFIKSAQLRHEDQVDRARNLAELWHWRSRTRQLIEQGKEFEESEEMEALGVQSFDDIVKLAAGKAYEIGDVGYLIDSDFAVKGKAYRDLTDEEWSEVRSITTERHFALNWLCGYARRNRWDETPTET